VAHGQEKLTDARRKRFEAIYSQEIKTRKAWAYKDMLRDLWRHEDVVSATVFFKDWYKRVMSNWKYRTVPMFGQ